MSACLEIARNNRFCHGAEQYEKELATLRPYECSLASYMLLRDVLAHFERVKG